MPGFAFAIAVTSLEAQQGETITTLRDGDIDILVAARCWRSARLTVSWISTP